MGPLLIAAVCGGSVIFIIFTLVIVIYCYRRCTRYDYTPLLEDLSLPVKLKRERETERNNIREDALINCQLYLRSHSGRYSYMGYFPNMGTRLEKHWFLVKQRRQAKDLIMNVWKKSQNCPLQFDVTTQKTLKELFCAISHPYIWPLLDLDLWTEQSLVISVQIYQKRGSLKDHIYGVSPDNYVENKYGVTGRPLPSNELKLYGLQVLQALVYLEEQGFPYHGNLHSGNVILEKRTCRLAGYENVFLGYASQLHPVLEKYFKDNLQTLDSLSFGHMMFEMSSGENLNQAIPDRIQLQKCKQPRIKELLEYIFDVNGDYPSIRNISEHEFFIGVRLKHLENKPPQQIQATPAMKSIFKSIRKGRRVKTKSGRNSSTRSKKVVSYGSVDRRPDAVKLSTSADRPSHIQETKSVPPPPPPPPTQSVPQVTILAGNDGRHALLSQIRKGAKLKKVDAPTV